MAVKKRQTKRRGGDPESNGASGITALEGRVSALETTVSEISGAIAKTVNAESVLPVNAAKPVNAGVESVLPETAAGGESAPGITGGARDLISFLKGGNHGEQWGWSINGDLPSGGKKSKRKQSRRKQSRRRGGDALTDLLKNRLM